MIEIHTEDGEYTVPNAEGLKIERDSVVTIQDDSYNAIAAVSLRSVDIVGFDGEIEKVNDNSNR